MKDLSKNMVTGRIANLYNNWHKNNIRIKNKAVKNMDIFFKQFEEWILKDIRYLLKLEDRNGRRLEPDRNTYPDTHRPFVAATILICCAIDVLAAFRYGRKKHDVGKTFENFVKEYFKKDIAKSKKDYNAEYVYSGLRNALLHGYSLGKFLALGHEDEEKHLRKEGDRIIIDVFMFYFDLEAVYEKYKKELLEGNFLEEFNLRWDYAPLVQYVPERRIKK